MRIGLISNPFSTQNRRGMAEIDALAARRGQIMHRKLGSAVTVADAVDEMLEAGVDLLVVNSGDGTVQCVQTALFARRPGGEDLPLFAILPRGNANMTAVDCGLKGRDARTLERLADAAASNDLAPHVVQRRVLRVDYADDLPAQYGMFFGAAGIHEGIMLCKGRFHAAGITGETSHLATMLSIVWGSLWRGLDSVGLHAHPTHVVIDGEDLGVESLLVVFATTLDRLILRSRPFWNAKDAPMRMTRVLYPPPRLLRSLPRVLYGGDRRNLPDGYRSSGANVASLGLDSPFTIDGEFFTPVAGRMVRLDADRQLDFVRL